MLLSRIVEEGPEAATQQIAKTIELAAPVGPAPPAEAPEIESVQWIISRIQEEMQTTANRIAALEPGAVQIEAGEGAVGGIVGGILVQFAMGLGMAAGATGERARLRDLMNKQLAALKVAVANLKRLGEEQYQQQTQPAIQEDYFDDVAGKKVTSEEELAAVLAKTPRPEPVPMWRYSTEEIFRMLKTRYAPTLPEGYESLEDMYAGLRDIGIEDDEELQEYLNYLQDTTGDAAEDFENWKAQLDEYLAGMVEMTKPVPWTTTALSVVMQPMLAMAKTVDPYFQHVTRPLAGEVMLLVSKAMPGEQEIERLFNTARNTNDWWHAMGAAFEHSTLPWGAKLAIEIAVDPITYVGFGLFPRIGAALPFVGSRLGPKLWRAEEAYLRTIDVPFQWFKTQWAGGRIPLVSRYLGPIGKTTRQIAEGKAQLTVMKAWHYPAVALGKPQQLITVAERRAALLEILERPRGLPLAADEATTTAAYILDAHMPYVTGEEVVAWAAKVGGRTETPTARNLTHVQDVIERTHGYPGGAIMTHEEAAAWILPALGAESTDENMAIIMKLLAERSEAILNSAKVTINAATTNQELRTLFYNRAMANTLKNTASPIYDQRFRIGVAGAMLKRFEHSTLNAMRLKADQFIVMPMAKSYLIFGNYGPMNMIETIFKGGLGRAGWHVKVGDGQIDALKNIWGHLPNADYELMTFVPRKGFRQIWRQAKGGEYHTETLRTAPGRANFIDKVVAPRFLQVPMVEVWAEMSMQHYAVFTRSMMKRWMNALAPEQVKGIQGAIKSTIGPQGLEPKLQQTLDDIIFEYAMADSRMLAHIPQQFTANRIARSDLTHSFEPFLEVEQAYKEVILAAVEDGSIWAQGGKVIDDLYAAVGQTMRESYLESIGAIGVKYNTIRNSIMRDPCRNYGDWIERVQTLEVLTENFSSRITHFRNIARAEGWEFKDIAAKDAHHMTMETKLADFIEEASKSMDDIRAVLIRDMAATGFGPEDTAKAERALDSLYKEWQSVHLARTRQLANHNMLKEKYPIEVRRRNAELNDEFWQEWRRLDEEAWSSVMPARLQARAEIEAELDALARATYPAPFTTTGRELSTADLAKLWDTTPNNMHMGLFDFSEGTLLPRSMFIQSCLRRADRVGRGANMSAEQMGFTPERLGKIYDNMLLDMRIADPTDLAPRMIQLEEMRQITWQTMRTKGIHGPALDDLGRYLGEITEKVNAIPGYGTDLYKLAQTQAMKEVRMAYRIEFADYAVDNANALDDILKSIFPYWRYEFHRLQWLPREFLRHPGVPLSLGRYNNYTDRGYIHIPGTSVEIQPFRGTIFGPLLTRLTMRDFPEYYDLFPGFSQTLDLMGRAGFYPGIHVQLPLTAFGYKGSSQGPQWGMLLPASPKTLLNAVLAVAPEGAGKQLRDVIFPDYFRDYQTILAVARRGGDGVHIYSKMVANEPLTDEEQQIWNAAGREIAILGMVFEQTAVFRYRPEEMITAWNAASQLIFEMTGITVEQQEELRQMGLKLEDYYIPLSPEMRRQLNELEAFKRWAGVTVALRPSEEQLERAQMTLFWDKVDSMRTDFEEQQEEIDRRFLSAETDARSWRDESSTLSRDRAKAVEVLHEQEYPNIPMTLGERIEWYSEKGMALPTFHPLQELLYLYYEIEPEENVWDDDAQTWITDWTSYYAQIDIIIETLRQHSPEAAEAFENEITKSMSPTRKLLWQVNREFIRPYHNRGYLIEKLFSDEDVKIIRQWYGATETERDAIEVEHGELIGAYRNAKEQAGVNMRVLDPTLDAWLFFFGYTTTLKTDQARTVYNQLCTHNGKLP